MVQTLECHKGQQLFEASEAALSCQKYQSFFLSAVQVVGGGKFFMVHLKDIHITFRSNIIITSIDLRRKWFAPFLSAAQVADRVNSVNMLFSNHLTEEHWMLRGVG